jgi:hypothetical protein
VFIMKCFTNRSRHFQCFVMFEDEYIHACNCKASVQLMTAASWQPGWHWLECFEEGWDGPLHEGNSFWFHFYAIVHDYCLGWILNGASCTSRHRYNFYLGYFHSDIILKWQLCIKNIPH